MKQAGRPTAAAGALHFQPPQQHKPNSEAPPPPLPMLRHPSPALEPPPLPFQILPGPRPALEPFNLQQNRFQLSHRLENDERVKQIGDATRSTYSTSSLRPPRHISSSRAAGERTQQSASPAHISAPQNLGPPALAMPGFARAAGVLQPPKQAEKPDHNEKVFKVFKERAQPSPHMLRLKRSRKERGEFVKPAARTQPHPVVSLFPFHLCRDTKAKHLPLIFRARRCLFRIFGTMLILIAT